MKKNPVETILGLAVLIFTAFFVFFVSSHVSIAPVEGYHIYVDFGKVGGLEKGADVRINGIKVGSVLDMNLSTETYNVKTTLSIKRGIKIPLDSMAAVVDSGLMGNKYIRIQPGISRRILKENEWITKSKSYKSLEEHIGNLIFQE
ncbi:MAG: MCE family protein [Alphaproteobacteria bacterium]|nr:MlaD family protein [Alphaproteobacteria bacterium]NCB49563.1 MCE family protein [Alphaproteobacteria bacterium]